MKIGIIGGGITGLTAAWALTKAHHEVKVFEAGKEPGGVMQTHHEDGWLVETGPNTVMARSPKIGRLIYGLGLEDEWMFADDTANKRYIVRNAKTVPLPMGVGSFLSTDLFSLKAKLRLLREPFISAWDNREEENLAHFVRRRLGDEFLDYAINPFVAGVYAGSPDSLSVKHAFPKLYELEQRYGSLIKGQIFGARERKKREETEKTKARLFTFKNGLQALPQRMAEQLGASVEYGAEVKRISGNEGSWKIDTGDKSFSDFDAVICTVPLHQLDSIRFETRGTEQLDVLGDLYYPPVSVVATGFKRDQVEHPLDGFGMLIPEAEGRSMLGTLFTSSLFPGRAPEGHVLLTTFVGGSRQPEMAKRSTEDLYPFIENDLQDLLGVQGKPVFLHHRQWPHAIPQYQVGYGKYLRAMKQFEEANPGFRFAGNFRGGISVSDCLTNALELVDEFEGGE